MMGPIISPRIHSAPIIIDLRSMLGLIPSFLMRFLRDIASKRSNFYKEITGVVSRWILGRFLSVWMRLAVGHATVWFMAASTIHRVDTLVATWADGSFQSDSGFISVISHPRELISDPSLFPDDSTTSEISDVNSLQHNYPFSNGSASRYKASDRLIPLI